VYRANPITPFNIRIGWVLASRIARVRLDEKARREAMALDPQGVAVSDPHGLALSPDEQQVAVAASGTHELLLMRVPGLPLIDFGGSDHIDAKLLADKERFTRIPLGGRPMAVRYSRDGKRIYIANYLLNSVQIVDAQARKLTHNLPLGGPATPSLARQGEAIFLDGQRSLDQWYSCHSCHYEGHTNAVTMDTRNDGTDRTFKTILSLRNVVHTGPWTWHGWQKDLDLAMRKSLTDSMLGPKPSEADVKALIAYLGTLTPPPNPYRHADGSLSPAAQRGAVVFRSQKAQCQRCHGGPHFTDGKIHEVGTGERRDAYTGYNPPTLIGVYDRMKYLHDGRAKSLAEVFTGAHDPDELNHNGKLTRDELADLVEYLKTL
jgi:cytochrome c peroxidase